MGMHLERLPSQSIARCMEDARTVNVKIKAPCMQKEHVCKAQELAMQASTSAQDSASAAMLLGKIHWDAERPREAFAAFRTAMMVLTQQGLRTQQAAKVLYWLAKCAMKLGRLESAKRDLRHAAGILTSIHPGGHADLEDVHEVQVWAITYRLKYLAAM
jgi:ATP/maltotriose-dependent transcriptional regulator MalT